MVNLLLLEYTMKAKGLDRRMLSELQGWSLATTNRRLNGSQDWTVDEVQRLRGVGFTTDDIMKIFFNDDIS